jgi:hypothetical protein
MRSRGLLRRSTAHHRAISVEAGPVEAGPAETGTVPCAGMDASPPHFSLSRSAMPTDSNAHPQTLDPTLQPLSSEERLKRMVETFKVDLKDITGKTTAGENFAAMIEASPHAKGLLLKAVEQGSLTRFVHDTGSSIYSRADKTISFNAFDIAVIDKSERMFAERVGTLGHEAKHATERAIMEELKPRLANEIVDDYANQKVTRLPNGKYEQSPMELTDEIKHFKDAHRNSESRAEIENFNSISSMLRKQNDGQIPSLVDIYRVAPDTLGQYMQSVIDPNSGIETGKRMRDGFTLNADMTLSATRQNVESMARIFYDSADKTSVIGHHFGIDYNHYYGSRAIQLIVDMKSGVDAASHDKSLLPRQLHLNMKALGLDEKTVEKFLDLPNGKPFVYYDTSSGKPVKSTFDPYVEKKEVAPAQEKSNDKPGGEPKQSIPGKGGKGPDPGDPEIGAIAEPSLRATNPVDRLSERHRADLGAIDAALAKDGRWDTASSRNIAGDLLLQVANDASVKEVQRVAFSDPTQNARVFAMYSLSQENGPHFHVSVHGPTSAQRDAVDTLSQVAALNPTTQGNGHEQRLVLQNEQTNERMHSSGLRM